MKEKTDILLFHGALGSQQQFNILKKLLQPHFKVHSFNFSGHGNSSTDREFSMELFQNDVLSYMEENSLTSANIFGYSMGGYVALKLAINYPEKAEKLMTLGTKIRWDVETAEKEVKLLRPEEMLEKIPQFVEMLKKEHGTENWKTLVLKTAQMMHGLGNGNAIALESLKIVEAKVLVALGSKDKMVSKNESQELVAKLNQGKFLEIEGFKHPIVQIDQEQLSEIIISYFLKK
ncbi:alpha/beta fold hydrolase [Mesonia sp.]|uniref:alpha/beta fold hydrolase n=1 Tax=Mesonia sp. TaxID=1960830 RepID=UPI003F970D01